MIPVAKIDTCTSPGYAFIMFTPDIAKFDFSPEAVEAFTEGDCWLLAIKLNALTGLGIITASASDACDDSWYHAANLLPDGTVIDIAGIWSAKEWLSHWGSSTFNGNESLCIQQWTPTEFDFEVKDCGFDPAFELSDQAPEFAQKVAGLIPSWVEIPVFA